ncbi:MAG TPA: hypothetical protein DEA08_11610, partial [Planctomycetes bacterium]|nr:hypothetical protein [Planctomycetota bacterium]
LNELREVVIAQRESGAVRLRQIATVQRGTAEREVITRLNGREAVELAIFKASGENTVTVAGSARARLQQLSGQGGLLDGVDHVVTADQSAFIRSALDDLASTAWT